MSSFSEAIPHYPAVDQKTFRAVLQVVPHMVKTFTGHTFVAAEYYTLSGDFFAQATYNHLGKNSTNYPRYVVHDTYLRELKI